MADLWLTAEMLSGPDGTCPCFPALKSGVTWGLLMGALAGGLAAEAPLFHSVSLLSLGLHLQWWGAVALTPFPPRHHPVAAGGARHAETSVAKVCLHSTSSVPGAKVTPAQGQCPEQPLTWLLAAPAQVTTDLRQRCTDGHTGTSVSAPMVAGIIALALEAK